MQVQATWTQQADAGTPKVLELQYDPVDQLMGALVRSNSLTGALLKRYLYNYDSVGNRTSEQIDSGVTSAKFNSLNQQTNSVGGGPIRVAGRMNETGTVWIGSSPAQMGIKGTSFVGYAQTTLGTNVISIKATDASNNSRTNQYQLVVTNSGEGRTLSYDLNGNLTASVSATRTNTYEWDAVNRLVAVESRTGVPPVRRSEFSYDGSGRRVRIVEKTNGVVQSDQRFLWCGVELCEERDASGAAVTKRFFGQGEQLGGTNYFSTRDHLGSVREMTDGTGAIRARYDYDPYGRRAKVSGDLEADFAFTGHYYHQASGLHLALFRAYDADNGRWLNRDPMEDAETLEGPNLYLFVGNDPMNWIDPDGLRKIRVLDKQTGKIREFEDTDGFLGPKEIAEIYGKAWAEIAGSVVAAEATCIKLFRRGGGLLNSNRYLRIGISRDGGRKVFRIGGDWIGKIKKDPHIVIKDLGPL